MPLDRTWHLAQSAHEIALTEFEYAVMRVAEAFYRWQLECLACSTTENLNGPDNAVLHVIRMKDRPKSLSDIARLLNRDDTANIQYSLRKLIRAKLIEKAHSVSKKGTSYRVTLLGKKVTDGYAEIRRALLVSLTSNIKDSVPELEGATKTLGLMTGIYDQAARIAATHRPSIREGTEQESN